MRCLLYPTGGSKSHFCWIPVKNDNLGLFKRPPFYTEDLNVARLFPSGVQHVTISMFPGTDLRLPRCYHVFTALRASSTIFNSTTAILHDQTWMGNILVVAVSKTPQLRLVHFPLPETALLDILICLYVYTSSAFAILSDRCACIRWTQSL
jgi:hypothetical protein